MTTRLALLQTDSSHAEVYQDVAAASEGIDIAHLWGADETHTRKIARPNVKVCTELEQAIVGVDGVMICGRWGDSHVEVAERALSAGIPVYVDKPFTTNAQEAQRLFDLYGGAAVPIFSASPLRFAREVTEATKIVGDLTIMGGLVTGLGRWPEFGPKGCEVHFYGIHAMEIVTALFGLGLVVSEVRMDDHLIESRLTRNSDLSLHLSLLHRGAERYEANVISETHTITVRADPSGDFYPRTLHAVADFVRRGVAPVSQEETLQNMRILDEMEAFRQAVE